MHPNIRGAIWNNGSLGNIIKYGILWSREEEGIRLIKKQDVKIASPQCQTDTFAWSNKVRAVSIRCIFFLWAMLLRSLRTTLLMKNTLWWQKRKKTRRKIFFCIIISKNFNFFYRIGLSLQRIPLECYCLQILSLLYILLHYYF